MKLIQQRKGEGVRLGGILRELKKLTVALYALGMGVLCAQTYLGYIVKLSCCSDARPWGLHWICISVCQLVQFCANLAWLPFWWRWKLWFLLLQKPASCFNVTGVEGRLTGQLGCTKIRRSLSCFVLTFMNACRLIRINLHTVFEIFRAKRSQSWKSFWVYCQAVS